MSIFHTIIASALSALAGTAFGKYLGNMAYKELKAILARIEGKTTAIHAVVAANVTPIKK